jgi:creatinine amidohydrolase
MIKDTMPPRLSHGHDAHAWHSLRWPAFRALHRSTVAILPIYSLTDWALDRPLDIEERLGAYLLDRALPDRGPDRDSEAGFLCLPPFRFTPKLSPANYFAMDAEAAHGALSEIVRSVGRSGIQRLTLFNTSPLLEEWVDVAARDLRVTDGWQMFCLNVSGIGLDLHPVRGAARSGLQAVLNHICGERVEAGPVDPEVAHWIDPHPEFLSPVGPPLHSETGDDGAALAARSVRRLASLLEEIAGHPPLEDRAPQEGGGA